MSKRPVAINCALAISLCGCRANVSDQLAPPTTHVQRSARAQAIRSATDVVITRITQFTTIGKPKTLQRIGAAGSSDVPKIPLYLARMTARIQSTLRGSLRDQVDFYFWLWKSGSHGGGRLFDASPDAYHVLFLTRTNGHLQTVGDYPAYDLLIAPTDIHNVLTELQKAKETDLFERLTRAILTVEYQHINRLNRGYTPYEMAEFAGLTSPFYFTSLLDEFCRDLPNAEGRVAACELAAREFPGRCNAYQLARKAVTSRVNVADTIIVRPWCQWSEQDRLEHVRPRHWPDHYLDSGWMPEPEHRRTTMRLYASAIDPGIHEAACRESATAYLPECVK